MIGRTLGHYEIVALIGRGGMGEVYRARDNRLKRDVALKILPPQVSGDPDRLARFQREAEILAGLNHPHIVHIYSVEEEDGVRFLTMEFVDGQGLDGMLGAHGLPFARALEIGIAVADALGAAHERGIVHRDLKPANVMLTHGGDVKVLDFGLARGEAKEPVAGEVLSELTTRAAALTEPGAIIGTPAYMSPEQVRGEATDRRTDIWAFGCLLFEMLTGTRAFHGKTHSDSLARVLQGNPDWDLLPKSLSPVLRKLLRHCLTEDPRHRLQAIGDVRLIMEDELAEPSGIVHGAAPTRAWSRWAPWLLLPVAAAGAWLLKPPADEPSPRLPVHFELELPAGERLNSFYRHGLAFSPDGRSLAFVSGTARNYWSFPDSARIQLRRLDQNRPRPVPGTEDGIQPFFSPDGQWLGFIIRDSQIKKVRLSGGDPVTICDCDASAGASWGEDGTIVFAGQTRELFRVAASGGRPEPVIRLDPDSDEGNYCLPHFLPDGVVLFTALRGTDWNLAQVYALSLASGERKLLIEGGADARYLPPGYLVFARGDALMAVRFDPRRLEVSGPEVPVLKGVSRFTDTGHGTRETGAAQFATSTSGDLAYAAGSVFPEIKVSAVWVDRQGHEELLDVAPKAYLSVRVSPDGKRVLLTSQYPTGDVWLYDIGRKLLSRQTFEGNPSFGIWGPGSNDFTFASDEGGSNGLYTKALNSGPDGATKLLIRLESYHRASSWSPNGELAFVVMNEASVGDIWVLSREGEAKPLLQTAFDEMFPEFSPNGRWIVYTSDESGREEVYVRPYPGAGPVVQISPDGGTSPAWSRDGREIFYRARRRFVSVSVTEQAGGLQPGKPVDLFPQRYGTGAPIRRYDVAPDGRFLMIGSAGQSTVSAMVRELFPRKVLLVKNWITEVRGALGDQR